MMPRPSRLIAPLVVVAVALSTPGCVLGKTQKRRHPPGPRALPWKPLSKQASDSATTFLFDPSVARTQTPGNGGFIMGDSSTGDVPWRPSSKVAVVPGRYRQGIQSTSRSYGFMWMPVAGILSPSAFTIEFWVKSDVPFTALRDETPVSVSGVTFNFGGGGLAASLLDEDAYPPVKSAVVASVRALPANRWENFALTYSRGELILYINGRVAATKAGVPAPQVWSDNSRGAGLTVGGAVGKGATDLAMSDLRISRVARVPGKRAVPAQSTLSITTAGTSDRIRQSLLGGLHTLTTPATVRMSRGVIRLIRTGKLINATPIKIGAPDAAHPSRGISGAYSYNWAVVDRTMRYLQRLGVAPYLSLGATPQLLGGKAPPLSGAALGIARSFQAPFNAQIPNNLGAWQLIVEDLAYRILKQDRVPVAFWGVWNEPNTTNFWPGSLTQYLEFYRASVNGVRAVDPRAAVGGAETSNWDPQWVSALIAFCAGQRLPLNFISWHYYSGDLAEIPEAEASVGSLAARYRIARPSLAIGEWAWQTANRPHSGALPFRNENYFLNDWSAAFAGASLIAMQRNDVVASVYTNPVATPNGPGFASGLMSPTKPWANLNVYRLWHMLPERVVKTRLDADPGIFAIGAKDRQDLSALVVSFHYQIRGTFPLTVKLPRRLAGQKVRVWLIDRSHADAFDAGPRHAQLQAASRVVSAKGQLRLTLPPRAIVLVEASLAKHR